jgi:hypothetical protein
LILRFYYAAYAQTRTAIFLYKLATVGAEMHKMLCKSMLEICNPLSISSFSVADEQLTSEGLYSVREKACD